MKLATMLVCFAILFGGVLAAGKRGGCGGSRSGSAVIGGILTFDVFMSTCYPAAQEARRSP